jgi:heterotetrameric sarcosine oxidase gamma subunit
MPVARSPISARPAPAGTGALTITDLSSVAKVQIRAPHDGAFAATLVPFGRAARDDSGALVLVIGSGPGEWLVIDAPGTQDALLARMEDHAAVPDEFVTVVDLSHGRALVRLHGRRSADLLAKVCGIDLADDVVPDGAALRTSVAKLVTDIVRDDAGGIPCCLLHCERSSGQYLVDALLDAGAEFGIAFTAELPSWR